jgi:hypothetical protein
MARIEAKLEIAVPTVPALNARHDEEEEICQLQEFSVRRSA